MAKGATILQLTFIITFNCEFNLHMCAHYLGWSEKINQVGVRRQ